MNNDLISRRALLDDIQADLDIGGVGGMVAGALKRYVKRVPAVDAVIPVRCKDCVWFKSENGCPLHESGYFKNGKMLPLEDDFCSYGERTEV